MGENLDWVGRVHESRFKRVNQVVLLPSKADGPRMIVDVTHYITMQHESMYEVRSREVQSSELRLEDHR